MAAVGAVQCVVCEWVSQPAGGRLLLLTRTECRKARGSTVLYLAEQTRLPLAACSKPPRGVGPCCRQAVRWAGLEGGGGKPGTGRWAHAGDSGVGMEFMSGA